MPTARPTEKQSADAVLMIRPVRFQTNPLTAESNQFQPAVPMDPVETSQRQALAEFEALRGALEAAGVKVVVADDTPEPHTPDSVFPNNWVSFHADGTAVLYPMEAENRRTERRFDVLEMLGSEHDFRISRIVDLSHYETESMFLEGTGSLVLDRVRRTAYACLSSRTHLEPVADFSRQLGYEAVTFEAFDEHGEAIYHTNVMMWLGAGMAGVCVEAIRRRERRDALLERLAAGGREVLRFDLAQIHAFAGNMLELTNRQGDRLLVMSEKARRSLAPAQLAAIERYARIVSTPLDHIEGQAGGGARCMLAAIHLPRQGQGRDAHE